MAQHVDLKDKNSVLKSKLKVFNCRFDSLFVGYNELDCFVLSFISLSYINLYCFLPTTPMVIINVISTSVKFTSLILSYLLILLYFLSLFPSLILPYLILSYLILTYLNLS